MERSNPKLTEGGKDGLHVVEGTAQKNQTGWNLMDENNRKIDLVSRKRKRAGARLKEAGNASKDRGR